MMNTQPVLILTAFVNEAQRPRSKLVVYFVAMNKGKKIFLCHLVAVTVASAFNIA